MAVSPDLIGAFGLFYLPISNSIPSSSSFDTSAALSAKCLFGMAVYFITCMFLFFHIFFIIFGPAVKQLHFRKRFAILAKKKVSADAASQPPHIINAPIQ